MSAMNAFFLGAVVGIIAGIIRGMQYARTCEQRPLAKNTGYWRVSVSADGTCNLIRQAPDRRQWIEFPQEEVDEMRWVVFSIKKQPE